MKSPKQIEKEIGNFSEEDKKSLENMSLEIDSIIKNDVINEDVLKRIDNISDELRIVHRKFYSRYINLLKLGYQDK